MEAPARYRRGMGNMGAPKWLFGRVLRRAKRLAVGFNPTANRWAVVPLRSRITLTDSTRNASMGA